MTYYYSLRTYVKDHFMQCIILYGNKRIKHRIFKTCYKEELRDNGVKVRCSLVFKKCSQDESDYDGVKCRETVLNESRTRSWRFGAGPECDPTTGAF